MELGIGIGDWDWGLGLGIRIGIWIGDWDWGWGSGDTTFAYLGYSFYYPFLRVVWSLDMISTRLGCYYVTAILG